MANINWDDDQKDAVLGEILSEPERGGFKTTPGIGGVTIGHSCTHCGRWSNLTYSWAELVAARSGQPVIDETGAVCMTMSPNGSIVAKLFCVCGNRNDSATYSPWDVDNMLNIAKSRGLVR